MKSKILLFFLLLNFASKAQDGILDVSFGSNGTLDLTFFSDFTDMKTDYYGKVVVLGKNTNGIPILARFTTNGSLDTTFDTDGIKEIDFGNADETPASFCIFDNSSGWGYLVTSSKSGKIARILNDGSFSSTFGTNGIYTYSTSSNPISFVNYDWENYKIIICQSNGGFFNSNGGNIYRLNPNGTPDTTFNNGNPVSFYFNSSGLTAIPSTIQSDEEGSIYVSGYYTATSYIVVAKFTTAGIRVWSYNPSEPSTATLPGYFLDAADNTSYSFGSLWSGSVNQMTVRKYNAAGTGLDTSFGTNGSAFVTVPDAYYANIKSVAGQYSDEDFKIIAAGRSREQSAEAMANITVARLNSDGSLDTTFGTNGITSIPTNLSSYTLPVASAIDYETGKLYIMGKTGAATAGRHSQQSTSTTVPVSLSKLNLGSLLSVPNSAKNEVTIYPNPVQDFLNFSEKLNTVMIYEITGRLIKSFNGNYYSIEVSDLSIGNYILRGETKNGTTLISKFVKN